MGTYAKVYLKYKGDETLERHDSWIDGDFGAIQCYCAFAVLGNVRNEHRLVPLFDNVESTPREEVKRVAASELYDYFVGPCLDRKSTRLNSTHVKTSYAVFCLQKRISNVTRR